MKRAPLFAAALLSLAVYSTAGAQTVRTFVSTTGSDAGPCSRTNPCRTFGAAMAAVDPSGEVVALDSGGYGPFVVTKSVAVVAPPGIHAAIAPTTGTAITIIAGVTDRVVLRAIYINSLGATKGITFDDGASLFVESCTLTGFPTRAIEVVRLTPTTEVRLFVNDSKIRQPLASGTGIFLNGSVSALVNAEIYETYVENTAVGLDIRSNVKLTVARSVFAANNVGVQTTSPSSGTSIDVMLHKCVLSNNTSHGLRTQGGLGATSVWLSGNMITNNGIGVEEGIATTIFTRLNNTVRGNLTNIVGVFSASPPI